MVTYKKPKRVEINKVDESGSLNVFQEVVVLWKKYFETTEPKLLLIDSYLLIVLLIGVINFVYCILFMPKPFHIFISSFISCVGSFVLGVCLRMQLDPHSEKSFPEVSHRKALFDFVLSHAVLHAVVISYIG
ncbi:hypothetical protein MXB_924 [Myxobolus squamalis]|nr:hypothetical protein MXB_924 [Myxobolus squamalis]